MTKIFFTIIVFIIQFGFGQQTSMITGSVTDEDGNGLPFANVYIVKSFDGGNTDEQGRFSFNTKKTGSAEITASLIGYKRYSQSVILEKGKTISLAIELKNNTINQQEVVVSASSYGSEKNKGIVMSSRDVVMTPGGAADIFQSLKTLPGLTQVSESAQLYIRGGDPIETRTMLNQGSMYHPYTFESSYGGLFSNINTNSVKGMYFSSGGFSTKYGNALSGILDIETKDEPLAARYQLGASITYASFNMESPIAGDNLGIRIDARQSYTRPMFLLNGGLDRFSGTPVSHDGNISLISKYSQTGRVKLFISGGEDKQGVNVDRPEMSGTFNGSSSSRLVNIQQSDIINDDFLLKTSLSHNRYTSIWKFGVLDLTRADEANSLRTDLEYLWSSRIKFLSGGEIEYRSATFAGIIPTEDYDIRNNAAQQKIIAVFAGYRYGAYTETEFSRILGIERLSLIIGGRVDHIQQLNSTWFDPRGGIGYRFDDQSALKFAIGIFHQHPDPRLYNPTDGNSDLNPMKAVHYIVGYDYKINEQTDLRVEAYSKEYSDLPLEDPILNYTNGGYGYARGIDIVAKGNLTSDINGWISYGYISSERKWMDDIQLSVSDYDITHNLTVVTTYSITPAWQIGTNMKYATGRPFTPVTSTLFLSQEQIYKPLYGRKNADRYPDYKRVDIRLTHLQSFYQNNFTVFFVEALNILNIENMFGYNYSADYSVRNPIKSYFGRRTIVVGCQMSL